MINFCTLFDINYLSRGLAMYNSLKRHCPDFHLYIFPFDDTCFSILYKLKLENTTLISLKEFENNKLLMAKRNRTRGEYCWTCASSTILYCLQSFDLDNCVYIDSDIYFYNNPMILLEEMSSKSILITPHNYSTKHRHLSHGSGEYCVQFTGFKKNKNGLLALEWWVNQCIKWCYAKEEDGKFGDQKYLDYFERRFNGVHICRNSGAGVAPWNIDKFHFFKNEKGLFLRDRKKHITQKVIFYHYHALKIFDNEIQLAPDIYNIRESIKKIFYKDYIKELNSTEKVLKSYKKYMEFKMSSQNPPINVIPLKKVIYDKTNSILRNPSSLLNFRKSYYSLSKFFYYICNKKNIIQLNELEK